MFWAPKGLKEPSVSVKTNFWKMSHNPLLAHPPNSPQGAKGEGRQIQAWRVKSDQRVITTCLSHDGRHPAPAKYQNEKAALHRGMVVLTLYDCKCRRGKCKNDVYVAEGEEPLCEECIDCYGSQEEIQNNINQCGGTCQCIGCKPKRMGK